MNVHLFIADPTRDHNGRTRWCQVCSLPESNQAHSVPERDDEEREQELRRVGEGDAARPGHGWAWRGQAGPGVASQGEAHNSGPGGPGR